MPPRQGLLLAEDEALKALFSNVTVTDDRNANRKAQVFFRYPDNVTERTYPFITVEMVDLAHATERQHSDQDIYGASDPNAAGVPDWVHGPASFDYWPSEHATIAAAAAAEGLVNPIYVTSEEFVPVNLTYQVATWARSAQHDRQLTVHILRRILPFRRGFIDIPADGTRRHLSVLDWTAADVLDQEAGYRKRIHRKVFTISITAELPSTDLFGIGAATSVRLYYKSTSTGHPL